MVHGRFAVLLSPPNSPRMSDTAAQKSHLFQPYESHDLYQTSATFSSQPGFGTYGAAQSHACDQSQYSLSSQDGRAQAVTSTGQHYRGYSTLNQTAVGFEDQWSSQNRLLEDRMNAQPEAYPASDSASPVNRLTPRSPSNAKDQQDEDELIDSGREDQDEDAEQPPMTAAELRAAKRKMKRFRLTHNQTRFLMSEFARQAHPDAAHRERLAREIPGLSARQVQVWFQNRRAKLKRLTNEDRERMMRSRALPAGFDTTQALHSPFGVQPPSMGGTISNVGYYAPYGEQPAIRPLTLDTLRRVPDYDNHGFPFPTPSGVSPALGSFGFTPPQSATDHLSPNSATSGISAFTLQQPTTFDASRRPHLALPSTVQAPIAPQSSMPRLPLHDRLARTTGDAVTSPLRTSVSYSALGSIGSHESHHLERAASSSEHNYNQQRPSVQRNASNPNFGEQSSYGLGFSYTQPPNYSSARPQSQQAGVSNVQNPPNTDTFRRPTYSQYASPSFPSQQQGYATQYPSQQFSTSAYTQGEQSRGQESREYVTVSEPAPPPPPPPPPPPQYLHHLGGSITHGDSPGQTITLPTSTY